MLSPTEEGPEVLLYNACLKEADLNKVLDDIRSTSYIDEIESGEILREESNLYSMIGIVKTNPIKMDVVVILQDICIHDGTHVVAIADDKSLKSVSLYYIKDNTIQDSMKTATKDVIEVCSNLLSGGVKIGDYKKMSGNAKIFDSGR